MGDDDFNSYTNIPVQILYDGKVVYTEYYDYSPYTVKRHTVNLNIGDQPGLHSVYVRINWQDHLNESNINNNQTETKVIEVIDNGDLWIKPVDPNCDYRAGTEVITSFIMHNDSASDVVPSDNNTVSFEAYWYDGNTKVSIAALTWDNAVIPAGKENLVWFRWTVPENIAGKKVYAEAKLNANTTVSEAGYENNIGKLVKTVAAKPQSTTPDTRYERQAPAGFIKPVLSPAPVPGYATWEIWEYTNGSFVKKYYGIELKTVSPSLYPDPDDPSATVSDGKITMKSGYGFYLSYSPGV